MVRERGGSNDPGRVDGLHYSDDHVVIATGSRPIVPPVPGAELGITLDAASGERLDGVDCVIRAVGLAPNTRALNLQVPSSSSLGKNRPNQLDHTS